MAKEKNQKKVAFYKQRRKSTPGITDEQLRSMWKDIVDKEAAAKKAEEDAKKAKEEERLAKELAAKKAIEDAKKAAEEAKKDEATAVVNPTPAEPAAPTA